LHGISSGFHGILWAFSMGLLWAFLSDKSLVFIEAMGSNGARAFSFVEAVEIPNGVAVLDIERCSYMLNAVEMVAGIVQGLAASMARVCLLRLATRSGVASAWRCIS